MQPGDLVKIKRAGIGKPAGSIALIMERHELETGYAGEQGIPLLIVRLCAHRQRERRYLGCDVEVISSSK